MVQHRLTGVCDEQDAVNDSRGPDRLVLDGGAEPHRHVSVLGGNVHPIMKRILVGIVALVTVFAVSQTVLIKQASAHGTGWSWCTGSAICTAKDQSGGGNHSFLNTAIGFCRSMPYNDEVTSVDSHFGVQVNFWRDASCNGGRYTVLAWGQVNNLGGTGFNDTFSTYCVGANTPSQCGPFFP